MSLTTRLQQELMNWARNQYAITKLSIRREKNNIKYEAAINPFDLHYIDPEQIKYTLSWTDLRDKNNRIRHPYLSRRNHYISGKFQIMGTVLGGSWDDINTRFENDVVYESYRKRFVEGVKWEDTKLYKQAVECFNGGEAHWGCSTASQFRNRLNKIEHLYDSIRNQGYKSQSQISREEFNEPLSSSTDSLVRQLEHEITVNIGRDGSYLFHDGRNRLSIAKILNLEEIPVVVLVRHREWQELRDSIARGEKESSYLSSEIENHPDMTHLMDDHSSI